jgi:hypothetical protein
MTPIQINGSIEGYNTTYDTLQSLFGVVGTISIKHFSVTFDDSEDNGFIRSTSASFPLNPPGAEKTFIDYDFSRKWRSCFKKISDAFSNRSKIIIDQIPV